jgi:hypothetical protein
LLPRAQFFPADNSPRFGDTTLANRCAADLAKMPTYSTTTGPNQGNKTVIEGWLGSGLLTVDNHGSATQPVFPAGEIPLNKGQLANTAY